MDVCRLCLDYTQTSIEDLILNNPLYNIQIKLLLPEIDVALTPTYGLCRQCSNSLEASYTFRNKCIQTEAFITEHLNNCKTLDLNSLKHPSVECVLLSHSNAASTINYDQVESGVSDDWQEEIGKSEEIVNDSSGVKNDVIDSKTFTFTCEHCNLVFQNEEIFHKHNKICNSISECKVEDTVVNIGKACNLNSSSENIQTSYSTQFKYSKSVRDKNGQEEEYICKLCNRKFPTIHRIQIHLHSHTRRKRFVCSVCDKSYSRNSDLRHHEEIHQGNSYNCSTCSKNFPSQFALKRHVMMTHSQKRNACVCELCGLEYSSKANLITHMRTHTGERPYKCEMCGKDFTQQSSLSTHIKCIHSEERPFQCGICQNTFNYKGTLIKHMSTHTDHNVKNFICSVENCGKRFYSKFLLQSHVLHHKYRKLLKHKCTICERAFESSQRLKRHTRCHTGEKPFECHICHKGFNQKYNVTIHMKSHRPKENRGTKGDES